MFFTKYYIYDRMIGNEGDDKMKTLLLAVNAKYIHPNLGIRLLKKNTDYDVDIKEFTIKDSVSEMVDFIIDNKYKFVGFSCYIWNIEIIKEVLTRLKEHNIYIMLGGPEVSYNAIYYLENDLADFVIKNEGEEAFDLLLKYLDNKCEISEVPNLYYKGGYTFDKLVDLEKTKMAYDLLDDVQNKIVYIETSRGCPYHCGYCMASLDNKVRFFNIDEIKKQIKILIERKARVFKFLDRTFNANKKNFIDLIDFIILNHLPSNSFQFEITGDLLSPEIIDYINKKAPENLFRFEIGIQSTNLDTNLSVGRIQNNEKLFSNIKKIQDAQIIDLHLDLIAGLPLEDYQSFEKTFNDVVQLKPLELQLGFLKLLHGTALMKDAGKHGYIWMDKAPYEVISNSYLSKEDIAEIHIAEDSFEEYYNKGVMRQAINVIIDNEPSPFEFFHSLGKTDYKHKGLEHLFENIDMFVKDKSYYKEFHKKLIIDYLTYFKVRPKAWWENLLSKQEKNEIYRMLVLDKKIDINLLDLYKYGLLVELDESYIVALYKPNEKCILDIKK